MTNPDDDSAFLRIVNTPKREIGPATLQKLGEWAMTRNKSLFTASFDMGLSQKLTGRGYDSLTRFTHWLGKSSVWPNASLSPPCAISSTVLTMSLVVRNLAEPQSGGNAYENVNQLFSWMTEMLEGNELDEPMTLTRWLHALRCAI